MASTRGEGDAGNDEAAAGGPAPLADKTAQSSHVKPESIAVFLEVDISSVSELPDNVLQQIASRARQFETLKSQKMLDDVTYGKSLTKHLEYH